MKINIQKITKIVNSVDPIHLLDFAPSNEYEDEALLIMNALGTGESVQALTEKIYGIFIDSFDEDIAGSIEPYREIAKKILQSDCYSNNH